MFELWGNMSSYIFLNQHKFSEALWFLTPIFVLGLGPGMYRPHWFARNGLREMYVGSILISCLVMNAGMLVLAFARGTVWGDWAGNALLIGAFGLLLGYPFWLLKKFSKEFGSQQ